MSDDNLREVYRQLCDSYRAIDDFRTRLLGFLPLATGTGLLVLVDVLLDANRRALARPLLGPIGVFGFAITLGLFFYELYGIKKCDHLIQAGRQLETQLGVEGQFCHRPRAVAGFLNEPVAAGIIYPAVLAAWLYVARLNTAPEAAWSLAVAVFSGGLALVFFFTLLLQRRGR